VNYTIDENKIYLSIKRGEKINETILKACEDNNVQFGWINGIGAIENPEVGFYDINSKKYIKKIFKGDFEIVGLTGNMTYKDGQRFIHTHIVFTDDQFNAYGGHLFDSKISAAGEFIIMLSNNKINREYNGEIGLALWNCKGK